MRKSGKLEILNEDAGRVLPVLLGELRSERDSAFNGAEYRIGPDERGLEGMEYGRCVGEQKAYDDAINRLIRRVPALRAMGEGHQDCEHISMDELTHPDCDTERVLRLYFRELKTLYFSASDETDVKIGQGEAGLEGLLSGIRRGRVTAYREAIRTLLTRVPVLGDYRDFEPIDFRSPSTAY